MRGLCLSSLLDDVGPSNGVLGEHYDAEGDGPNGLIIVFDRYDTGV